MKPTAFLSSLFPSRRSRPVRHVPAVSLPLEQVRDAVTDIAGTRGWAALHQELDAAIADAIDDVTVAPATGAAGVSDAAARSFAAGGVDHLRRFQARLLELTAKGPERPGEEDE
jgi:hypothetical protein